MQMSECGSEIGQRVLFLSTSLRLRHALPSSLPSALTSAYDVPANLEISEMASGTVKWFNSQKGYGFIAPQAGGKDVFVHISAVERAGLSGLKEGQVVEYEEVANRGKTSAENLKVHR